MVFGANSVGVTGDMDVPEYLRTGCVPDFTKNPKKWQFTDQLDGVTMRLKNRELWQRFKAVGTEMIITKPGRRMYPYVEVNLEGLDPEDSYVIVLELRQCSECRYRYHGNEWVESGRANPPHGEIDNMFVLSPKKGRDWMQDSCSMYFVKITNNNERIKQKGEEERPVVLTSMQKYMPVVHVIRTGSKYEVSTRPKASFLLPEAEFIAVTAYQNGAVKDLKIANNPFAKAFRPGATSKRKRKSNQTLEAAHKSLMSDGGSSYSTSSASPHSLSTSSSAIEIKVVDEDLNDQTPISPPSYTFCPPQNQSTPYYPHQEHTTRMVEMMRQYMLVRPWEVPPIAICNSNPYGFNFHYPMPLYWNSIGYPVPQPPFYPALPPPPAYPIENELIDLSMRAHDKDNTEENPT